MKTALTSPLPVLPLRQDVLFPGTTMPVPLGRKSSLELAKSVERGDHLLVAVQRDATVENPAFADLQEIGVLARVERVRRRQPRGAVLVLAALERVRLTEVTRQEPFLLAQGAALEAGPAEDVASLVEALKAQLEEVQAEAQESGLGSLLESLQAEEDAGRLADRTASLLGLPFERELGLLLQLDAKARLEEVFRLLAEVTTLGDVNRKVQGQIRREMSRNQREAILREQLKAIQKELGEGDDDDELGELKARLADKGLPADVQKVVDRELGRLPRLQGAEQGVVRTYLEWLADVPWSERSEAGHDIHQVQAKLEEDHAGLDEVKERILEHLAVLRLAERTGSGKGRGTVLCLAGPPGVGKTSLGQSVADALGRPFVRVALGGVRDEAEIRGHRRTYVGALPGRIAHALKKAQVRNPVFLLDEIDKLGRGWAGDPEAALLEVLDPEQNDTFTDHYLELPIDLSEVLFICTANDLGQLSAPLRDRLEIIELDGYTVDEKVAIAQSHLLPRELGRHGLATGQLALEEETLRALIEGWTREAGVRQLARHLTKLCRTLALKVEREGPEAGALVVEPGDLGKILGKRKHQPEVKERTRVPGVATGLAWTPVGGDILFIETSRMPGSGKVETTGQLGDVMKESARAALTYVRSHAEELDVDPAFLSQSDVHLHIPAGAVPKDGPSAGVTMFTALVSLLTGRRVRSDTAMTGEASLRGRVLPVGGIKSKVLAAHRAGLTRVVLPAKNAEDWDEVPVHVREELELVLAEDMTEVLAAALEPASLADPAAPDDERVSQVAAH